MPFRVQALPGPCMAIATLLAEFFNDLRLPPIRGYLFAFVYLWTYGN